MATLTELKREFLVTYNELERWKTKHLWNIAHAPISDERIDQLYAEMDGLVLKLTRLDDQIESYEEEVTP